MYEVLKHLPKDERAILHQALLQYTDSVKSHLAENEVNNVNHAFRRPLQWLKEKTEALRQKLFTECFPEDLEPLDYFIKEQQLIAATRPIPEAVEDKGPGN